MNYYAMLLQPQLCLEKKKDRYKTNSYNEIPNESSFKTKEYKLYFL